MKKLIAFFLTVVMVCSLLPVQVRAGGGHTHSEVIFTTAWNTSDALPDSAGSYYLTCDVTLTDDWFVPINATTNLCLNGYSIKLGRDGWNSGCFYLQENAVLNLYDCKETGTIKGDGGMVGAVHVKNGSTFNMYGGCIIDNEKDANGGGAGVDIWDDGTFNMYGGSIKNNKMEDNAGGGVCIQDGGTMNMYGGEISGNQVVGDYGEYGGGIAVLCGTLNIFGGIIKNNSAPYGGGVFIGEDGGCVLNMTAGEISGNTASVAGGGIYGEHTTLNFGGTAVVRDNKLTSAAGTSVENNVYLLNDKYFTIHAIAPKSGMEVGITTEIAPTEAAPVKISTNGTSDDTKYFFSDVKGYKVLFDTDHLNLAVSDDHEHHGVVFTKWSDPTTLPTTAGSYYLTCDVTLTEWTGLLGITKENPINICLNGHNVILKANGYNIGCISLQETTFSLYDCKDTGAIKGDGARVACPAIYVNWASTFNMYGGCICDHEITDEGTYGAGVQVIENSVFNMYGGSIKNNKSCTRGAGVEVEQSSTFNMYDGEISGNEVIAGESSDKGLGGGVFLYEGTVNILGGTIKDNKALYGGGVYVGLDGGCTLNMTAGEITGNTASVAGGGIYGKHADLNFGGTAVVRDNKLSSSSGASVENNVYLLNDKYFTIHTTAPESGMKVGVTTETAPTAAAPVRISTNGSSGDENYFFSDNPDYTVVFKAGTGTNDHLELVSRAIPVDVPTAITGLIYNGSEQTGVPEGTGYKITGNKETNAGDSYKATATLESGYIWSDGTSTSKDIPWAIGKATLEQPTIRSKVYNGQLQKADIDPAGLPYTVTLNDGGIEAGSYPVELTITDFQNYQWAGLNSPLCSLTFIITGAPAYTVRAYADNGNRVDADKTANVLKGETVKITVTPADGYVCESYAVKTVTTNALVPVTNNAFTMPEDDVYITAVFTKNEAYVVNGYADAMGNKVTPDINKAVAGTKITLKVFTADKYSLKSLNVKTVSGASVTLASDNTFTMPAADVVVNALFEKQKDDPIIIIIPRLTPTPEPTKTPEPTDAPKPTEAPEPTKEPEVTVYPTEEDFLLNSIRLNKKYKVTQPEDIIDIKWGKVKDADGYLVYAEYCGNSFKQVARLTDNEILTYSLDSLNGEPINQADEFKIMVKAYKVIDGQDVIIGKSIHAHIAGSDSVKYTNANGIKVTSPTKPVLSIGETSSITATVLLEDKSKKPLSNNHARELRFMSANPNVAVVADDGTITAVGAGKCNIYVYARNGFAKKITVTVK